MKSSGSNSESAGKKKTREIEPPVCLGDLFAENDEETEEAAFSQLYEVQELDIGGAIFKVRQFAWHRANANKVWPGTFNLGEYICLNKEKYGPSPILELGAATGALSVYLSAPPFNFKISTSDIDDGGEVEENIYHNFELNGLPRVLHVPHSWGTGWMKSLQEASKTTVKDSLPRFKYIIASDILLYVSAYPDLVQTLCEIFEVKSNFRSLSKIEGPELLRSSQDSFRKNTAEVMAELWEGEDEAHPDIADDSVADLISVGIISGSEVKLNDVEEEDKEVCVDFCSIPCAAAILLPDTRKRGESRESNSSAHSKGKLERKISHNAEEDAVRSSSPESVEVVMGELVDEDDLDAVVAAIVCDSDGEYSEEPEPPIREAETIFTASRKGVITPDKGDPNSVKFPSSDPAVKGLRDLGPANGTGTASRDGAGDGDGVKTEGFSDKVEGKGGEVGGGGTGGEHKGPPVEFLMSWNRRIAESAIFFDLMAKAGFLCEHKGKCVYSFTVRDPNDI